MRRRSRECALQLLYQLETNGLLSSPSVQAQLGDAITEYWSSFADPAPVDRDLTERLVRGVVGQITALDEAIEGASKHWRVKRMTTVDRNLLRVAAYELRWCEDIPTNVSINEALEIAKRFSGSESVPFLNGILDHIAKGTATPS